MAAVLAKACDTCSMAEAGQVAKGPEKHTWVNTDVSRAVVADLVHVQPDPINGRHIIEALHRQAAIQSSKV